MTFVVFEGPKGVGKSTTIAAVAKLLRDAGRLVHEETEPTSSPIGQLIRQVVDAVSPRTLALLVAADRSEHQALLRDAQEADAIVLCDRYVLSSLALQVMDGLEPDWLLEINRTFSMPDLCVVLSAPREMVADRRIRRGTVMDRFGNLNEIDRELSAIHGSSRILRAEGWRLLEVDACAPVDDIARRVATSIERLADGRYIAA